MQCIVMENKKFIKKSISKLHQSENSGSLKSVDFPLAFEQHSFLDNAQGNGEQVLYSPKSHVIQKEPISQEEGQNFKNGISIFRNSEEKDQENKKYATVDKDIVKYYQLQDYCEKLDTLIIKYCDDPILKNIRNESEQNYRRSHRQTAETQNQKGVQSNPSKGRENRGKWEGEKKDIKGQAIDQMGDECDEDMSFWLSEVSCFISFLSSNQFKKLFEIKEDILSLKNPINHAVIRELDTEYKRLNKKVVKKNTLRRNLRKTKTSQKQLTFNQKQNFPREDQEADSEQSQLCQEDCHICRICWQFFDNGHQLGGHMAKKHPGNSQIYRNKRAVKLISCLEKKRKDYFVGLRNSINGKDQIYRKDEKKKKPKYCSSSKTKKLGGDIQNFES